MSLFLAAHGAGHAGVAVKESRFLNDFAASFNQIDLTFDFVLDGLLNEAEGVDVLQLGAGAELFLIVGAHRDVGVTTEAAFLQVAIANPEINDDLM